MDFFSFNKSHTRDVSILPFIKAERVEGGEELERQLKMAVATKTIQVGSSSVTGDT